MSHKRSIRGNYFFFALAWGSSFPFLAPYFQELGASNRELGFLMAIRYLIAILAQPFWSWIAESTGNHPRLAAILAVTAALFSPSILLTHSLLWAGALLALWSFFFSPLNSLGDTVAIQYLGEIRRNRFSRLRIFVSLGFMIGVLVFGRIYDIIGLAWIFPVFSVGAVLSAFYLRRIPPEEDPLPHKQKNAVYAVLKNRNIVVFLIAILLVEIGNQMGYAYLSVYAKSLSANNGQIGLMWAVATGCELVMMIFVPKIVDWIGVRTMLLLGMIAVVFRWTPFFFAKSWWHLIPFQAIQVFTIPFIYVGAVIFMDTEGPRELRFTAQSFYSMFVLNVAAIVGTVLGGIISQWAGYHVMYVLVGVFGLAGSLVFSVWVRWKSVSDSQRLAAFG